MKKTIMLFVLLFSIFMCSSSYAETFYEWNVEVELFRNGDGVVKNTWVTEEDKGTEKYLPIGSLGGSEILDYRVRENGKLFIYKSDWDSDDSREEKTGRYGMIQKGDGVELVFGIGEYGPHRYEFQYRVTDMVKALEDGQSLYWQFVNSGLDNPPEKMEIRIKGYTPFTSDTVKMWSFGYTGDIQLEPDGTVAANSSQALTKNSYGTILLQFPEGYFNTSSTVSRTQEEQREEAFKGSDYGTEKEETASDYVLYLITGLITAAFIFIFVTVVRRIFSGILGVRESLDSKINRREYERRERELKGQYYRNIPYEGNLEELLSIMDFSETIQAENIFTVYLLKWIKEETIELVPYERGLLFKREATGLRFMGQPDLLTHGERSFYELLKKAGKGTDLLEQHVLEKYLKNNNRQYYNILKSLRKSSTKKAVQKGLLIETEKGLFRKYKVKNLTESGFQVFDKNIQFRNYLKDYSLLNEREGYDVHLWEDFMLYAALYGITEEVYEQFEMIEPRFHEESMFTPSLVGRASNYSSHMSTYAKPSSSYSSSSRSSGGGGSSSSGGGGGSSGGGSGGGSR